MDARVKPAHDGPRVTSRSLKSCFERRAARHVLQQGEEEGAQKEPQPGEDQAQVVTNGAEDDVGGVAGAAFEIAAAEMAVCFHVPNDRLDRGAAPEFTFDAAEHAALLS